VKLKSSARAKADLAALRAWFNERNPAAGKRVAARIKQKLAHLRKNPRMGRVVEGRPELRELVVDSYVLPYLIEGDTICIVRVWHGAQDRSRAE
jgi:plasmid stabilization system protein ParE